jgi:hypothetical protein
VATWPVGQNCVQWQFLWRNLAALKQNTACRVAKLLKTLFALFQNVILLFRLYSRSNKRTTAQWAHSPITQFDKVDNLSILLFYCLLVRPAFWQLGRVKYIYILNYKVCNNAQEFVVHWDGMSSGSACLVWLHMDILSLAVPCASPKSNIGSTFSQ